MERLQYLIRRRESYLSAFTKIIKNINGLNKKIVSEKTSIEKINSRQEEVIKQAQSKIEEGQKGFAFLEEQTKINEAQIQKIESFVQPTLPEKSES